MSQLINIRSFESLVSYLNTKLGWPVTLDEIDDQVFEYESYELGIDDATAVKIDKVVRFRAFEAKQPWSVFYIQFATGKLPIVVMRRILSRLVLKSQQRQDQQHWHMHDLLFITNFGDAADRQMSFAHFTQSSDGKGMPTLKVLGWDGDDTKLRLDDVERRLTAFLKYPHNDIAHWPQQWARAFTLRPYEVIKTSKELSIQLARLARDIRARLTTVMQYETDKGPFTQLMKSFQTALIQDLTADDFADMYAQTIAYGLLSTRIADPAKQSVDDLAAHLHTNPFLRELMQTFLTMGGRDAQQGIDFDELGINEVVDLLNHAQMDEVLRDFNNRNAHEDPVIHFYELFLKEYDAKKRMQRGVFYTPRPVVSYIVRSVHELLQTEFGLADGLADTTTWGEMLNKHPDLKLPPLTDEPDEDRTISLDEPFVQILDPATGTGTFLVEVIDVIHRTMVTKWEQQRLTHDQQRAAWNDYVPKHLLPRLHAFELMMAPYAIAHMKIGLKLAETGYRFGTEERARIYLTNALETWVKQLPLIGFDALAHEAAAVNEIKCHKRFTIVIGNPPYAGHSSNIGEWIEKLVGDYFSLNGAPLKEANSKWLRDDYVKFIRLGQEMMRLTSVGVFSFITNHGYIDNPTFRGMRYSLLNDFRRIWVVDLHGNTKKKEVDDAGDHDENVFDIQQGVSVFSAVFGHAPQAEVWLGHVRGSRTSKYELLATQSPRGLATETVIPATPFFLFLPQNINTRDEYHRFPAIAAEARQSSLGVLTKRDALVLAFSADELLGALRRFADPRRADREVAEEFGLPVADKDRWDLRVARKYLSKPAPKLIRKVLYRPFDFRFLYYDDMLVARTNRRVLSNMEAVPGNRSLIFGRVAMANGPGPWDACFASDSISEQAIYRRSGGTVFPLYLAPDSDGLGFDESPINFSRSFTDNFAKFGSTPEDIFHYIYAVFHSPGYRSRYAEFLKIDFPRLPLTESIDLFRALAHLGEQLVALHLMESPLLDTPITQTVGSNWEVSKVGYADGTVWVDGKGTKVAFEAGTTGFVGVPEEVWNFHIGGYQVCEKWLKDRKGRTLSADDIAHYQKIVVALYETIRLMAEIDVVIDGHGGWPGAFYVGDAEVAEEPARPQFGQVAPATPKRRAAEEKNQGTFLDE